MTEQEEQAAHARTGGAQQTEAASSRIKRRFAVGVAVGVSSDELEVELSEADTVLTLKKKLLSPMAKHLEKQFLPVNVLTIICDDQPMMVEESPDTSEGAEDHADDAGVATGILNDDVVVQDFLTAVCGVTVVGGEDGGGRGYCVIYKTEDEATKLSNFSKGETTADDDGAVGAQAVAAPSLFRVLVNCSLFEKSRDQYFGLSLKDPVNFEFGPDGSLPPLLERCLQVLESGVAFRPRSTTPRSTGRRAALNKAEVRLYEFFFQCFSSLDYKTTLESYSRRCAAEEDLLLHNKGRTQHQGVKPQDAANQAKSGKFPPTVVLSHLVLKRCQEKLRALLDTLTDSDQTGRLCPAGLVSIINTDIVPAIEAALIMRQGQEGENITSRTSKCDGDSSSSFSSLERAAQGLSTLLEKLGTLQNAISDKKDYRFVSDVGELSRINHLLNGCLYQCDQATSLLNFLLQDSICT
ncbi:unnamed protein product [Amoebophrya sp. A25]|nr:unnamed protein product [Amoebophrya sp. A25]|eukprot:GSA25T00018014001.1